MDISQYVIGGTRHWKLRYDWDGGGQQLLVSREITSGNYLLMKGSVDYPEQPAEFENILVGENFIYRFLDTSPNPQQYYIAASKRGGPATWLPRHMEVGETFYTAPTISYFKKADNAPAHEPYSFPHWVKFAAHHNSLRIGSFAFTNVIEFHLSLSPQENNAVFEKHWYSKATGGLVAFERYIDGVTQRSEFVGWATVSEDYPTPAYPSLPSLAPPLPAVSSFDTLWLQSTSAGGTRIRQRPTTDSNVVGSIREGESFVLLVPETDGYGFLWYPIIHGSAQGWVRGDVVMDRGKTLMERYGEAALPPEEPEEPEESQGVMINPTLAGPPAYESLNKGRNFTAPEGLYPLWVDTGGEYDLPPYFFNIPGDEPGWKLEITDITTLAGLVAYSTVGQLRWSGAGRYVCKMDVRPEVRRGTPDNLGWGLRFLVDDGDNNSALFTHMVDLPRWDASWASGAVAMLVDIPNPDVVEEVGLMVDARFADLDATVLIKYFDLIKVPDDFTFPEQSDIPVIGLQVPGAEDDLYEVIISIRIPDLTYDVAARLRDARDDGEIDVDVEIRPIK